MLCLAMQYEHNYKLYNWLCNKICILLKSYTHQTCKKIIKTYFPFYRSLGNIVLRAPRRDFTFPYFISWFQRVFLISSKSVHFFLLNLKLTVVSQHLNLLKLNDYPVFTNIQLILYFKFYEFQPCLET